MLTIRAQTAFLNRAISEFIGGTKKDVQLETQRQAKLLCIELAAAASPKPRGVSGLAAAIPKIWGRKVRGELGAIVKGVRGLGLFALAKLNDPGILKNSYYPTKVRPQMRLVTKLYRKPNGEVVGKQVTEISALHRIMESAKTRPQLALFNLRKLLKNHLSGQAPKVYNNFMGATVKEYYATLSGRAKTGKRGKASPKLYINTPDTYQEREALAGQIDRTIGTVKAGWIQAGLAIPVKAGPRIPAWLLSKRTVGSGTATQAGMDTSVKMLNTVGNAIGIDDRTDYVRRTLQTRQRKVVNGLREALKAQGRKWYKKQGLPIPADLVAGNPETNTADIS
jgi:hypothetical protein